jgi:hypothetical protein
METLYYPLIDLLNRHSSRWRNLNLFVSRTLFYQFSGDGGTISILNGLTLVTLPPFPDELDSERFSLQTVSPQPQFVKLFNVTLSSVDIKWNNLIQLEGSLDVNELLEIFHYAHQLVGCTITVCSKTTTEYRISETPVFLHFLQHLEIESCLVDPAEIMDMITTPRLRHLEFNCGHDEDLSAHSFISFIIRSNCNLEVFSLNIPIVEDGTMIAILKHLPSSLTQLSLGVDANLSLTKEVCDLFKSPRNPRDAFENRFFPNLESFQCDSPQVLSWPELIETFFGPLSASPASRRLRTLDLKVESNDFLTPIDPNTLRIIQKLQESGVNISIKKWGLDTGYAPHSMIDDDDEVPSTLRKWRKYFHQKMGT